MKPRAIEVRIGELVLEGFAPADRLRIGAAVERELARLVGEGGLGDSVMGGGAREAVDAGSFTRAAQATPAAVGGDVARSVYAGLKR
jgi:hypothetical protein